MMKKKLICVLLAALMLVGVLPVIPFQARAESTLTASDDCISMIKSLEGFSATPYWDISQYTVGYGTRCPDEDYERYMTEGITEEEAEQLLRNYVAGTESKLNSFADKYSLEFSQNQFDALIMFSYALGSGWMSQTGTFRSAVINGATGNEFIFAMAQWCRAAGQIRKSMIQRRLREANVYLNGVYSMVTPSNYSYVIYDANGGETEVSVQGYDADLTAALVAEPTYEGYTFDGWFTAASGGAKVTSLDHSTKGKTLYAHWTSNTPGETTDPTEPEETTPPATEPEETTPPATTEPEETTPPETTTPSTPDTAVTVKVTGTSVNVRKGPGTNYGIVTSVKSGNELTITEVATGSGYTWGKYSKGWICLKYTNYDSVIQEEEEEPEEETPKVIATGTVKLSSGSLRVRSSAGTSSTVVGYISNGSRVEIYEYKTVGSTKWARVEKGWISTDYVVLDAAGKDDEKEETDTPTTETVVATGTVSVSGELRIRSGAGTSYSAVGSLKNGDKVEIYEQKSVSGVLWGRISKGWISLAYVKLDAAEPAVIATGTVTGANKLRIRSGAGTSYSIVGNLNKGDKVEIYEKVTVGSTIWGKVSQGWICLDYVKLDGSASPEDTSGTVTKTVTASSLRIRSGAGSGYSIVGYLTSGTKVTITETKTVNGTQWGKIDKGWICMDYVK